MVTKVTKKNAILFVSLLTIGIFSINYTVVNDFKLSHVADNLKYSEDNFDLPSTELLDKDHEKPTRPRSFGASDTLRLQDSDTLGIGKFDDLNLSFDAASNYTKEEILDAINKKIYKDKSLKNLVNTALHEILRHIIEIRETKPL